MRYWKFVNGLILGIAMIIATPVWAQRYDGSLDQRLDRQAAWIDQGIRTGALTPHEARRLTKKHARLVREAARFEADGSLTHQERHRLEHKLRQTDRQIYRELHDRQVVLPWPRHRQHAVRLESRPWPRPSAFGPGHRPAAHPWLQPRLAYQSW